MIRKTLLCVMLAILLAGCSTGPKVEITSVKYIETINAGGVYYNFEGKDNIEIVLDFRFDPSLSVNLDPASEDFRDEIFTILAKGAHFYYRGEELERVYGYWPSEAGSDFATELTLFYVVPSDHSTDDLRFVFDGEILGEGGAGIDTVLKPGK